MTRVICTFFFTLLISKGAFASLVPAEAFTWDTNIKMKNFTEEQQAKVHKAVDLIKKIIVSEKFREKVINYTHQGKREFIANQGFSNEEIYQQILDGAEIIGNKDKNNMMDVELELYFQATKTIGYTYPNTTKIWMNTKYFDKYTPEKVADNLMHEWMHK